MHGKAAPDLSQGYYNRRHPPFHSETAMTNNDPSLNPGDEAKPGTPGAAEDVCEQCSGSGKQASGAECINCGGSGKVIRGIGGG